MPQLFFGILILLAPLLLVFRWGATLRTLSFLLPGIFLGHVFIAFLLQALHFFSYPVLISIHGLIAVGILVYSIPAVPSLRFSLKKISPGKVLFFIAALLIVTYQLFAVRFDYTGPVNTINGEAFVIHDSYNYPLFSDEWVTVAIADMTIRDNQLPFTNPFTGAPYQNYLFIFQTFIASVSLLLGISALSLYASLAIIFGVILVVSMFLLLRALSISYEVSVLTMLVAPLVTNASNLPMLWYLLPWNIGFICLLFLSISLYKRYTLGLLISTIATILFYPPYIVLVVPMISLVMWQQYNRNLINKIIPIALFVSISPLLLIGLLAFTTNVAFIEVAVRILQLTVRPINSLFGATPSIALWDVLPWITIPFAAYGIYVVWHKLRFIIVAIGICLLLWIVSPLTDTTFLLDYHRAISVAALLLIIMFGIGIDAVYVYMQKKWPRICEYVPQVIGASLIIIFFIFVSSGYTNQSKWRNFIATAYHPEIGFMEIKPVSSVNRYVHPDDIRLFENISKQRFLSNEWKSLIIATMTDNIPITTKPSTLTIRELPYGTFMLASCEEKYRLLERHKVAILYIPKSDCAQFQTVGVSEEGLHLYTYNSE